MADPEFEKEIHQRLLKRDPIASPALVKAYIQPLTRYLERRFGQHARDRQEPDAPRDAAADALMSYIKHPERFKPEKRGLLGYLKMSAEGDLRNRLKTKCRQLKFECLTDPVELPDLQRNKQNEELAADGYCPDWGSSEDLLDQTDSDKDRQLVQLMVEGERRTEAYAEVLGISNRPFEEQRHEVKRHKDRLIKRMQRMKHHEDARIEEMESEANQ